MDILNSIDEIWNNFLYPVFDTLIATAFFYWLFFSNNTAIIEYDGTLFRKKNITSKPKRKKCALYLPMPVTTKIVKYGKENMLASIATFLVVSFVFYKLVPIFSGLYPIHECNYPVDGKLREQILFLVDTPVIARIWSCHPAYSFSTLCDKIVLTGAESARYKALEHSYILLQNICNTLQMCSLVCFGDFIISCLKRKPSKIIHSAKTLLLTFAIILCLLAMMLRQSSKAVIFSAYDTYYMAIENGISITSEIHYDRAYEALESEKEVAFEQPSDFEWVIYYFLTH